MNKKYKNRLENLLELERKAKKYDKLLGILDEMTSLIADLLTITYEFGAEDYDILYSNFKQFSDKINKIIKSK